MSDSALQDLRWIAGRFKGVLDLAEQLEGVKSVEQAATEAKARAAAATSDEAEQTKRLDAAKKAAEEAEAALTATHARIDALNKDAKAQAAATIADAEARSAALIAGATADAAGLVEQAKLDALTASTSAATELKAVKAEIIEAKKERTALEVDVEAIKARRDAIQSQIDDLLNKLGRRA